MLPALPAWQLQLHVGTLLPPLFSQLNCTRLWTCMFKLNARGVSVQIFANVFFQQQYEVFTLFLTYCQYYLHKSCYTHMNLTFVPNQRWKFVWKMQSMFTLNVVLQNVDSFWCIAESLLNIHAFTYIVHACSDLCMCAPMQRYADTHRWTLVSHSFLR